MMTKNQDFRYLNDPLPCDIARRKGMGDIEGALRLIDAALSSGVQPELAARLRVERMRLPLLGADYTLTREEAIALLQKEWPACTGEVFDALVDDARIDWRCINGRAMFHERFVETLRLYPQLAPGLKQEPKDNSARDAVLSRMKAEGGVTARITLKAAIAPAPGVDARRFEAWLPIPAACPQQSEIEILDCTPGGLCAPLDAPQRTIWWEESEKREFTVTYRYLHRAACTDPLTIVPDKEQTSFCLEEQEPHLVFTPYLRRLTERVTQGCAGPVEKAKAIYDYVTGNVDYRFQPAYLQLDSIADYCAAGLRGDCGVFALLFIAMCRIAGIPAQWQSGLYAYPGDVGSHDWAMFYIAPHGWLWADCSFGSSARRNGDAGRRAHYFGNLDPWRMVANSAFFAPLTPPNPQWRNDPFDNQSGELVADGRGLMGDERVYDRQILEFELL